MVKFAGLNFSAKNSARLGRRWFILRMLCPILFVFEGAVYAGPSSTLPEGQRPWWKANGDSDCDAVIRAMPGLIDSHTKAWVPHRSVPLSGGFSNPSAMQIAANVLEDDFGLSRDCLAGWSKASGNNAVFRLESPPMHPGPALFPRSPFMPQALQGKKVDGWFAKVLREDRMPGVRYAGNVIDRDADVARLAPDAFKDKRIHLVESHVVTSPSGRRAIFQRPARGRHPADVIFELFGEALEPAATFAEQRARSNALLAYLMDAESRICFTAAFASMVPLHPRCNAIARDGIILSKVSGLTSNPKWRSMKTVLDELRDIVEGHIDPRLKQRLLEANNKSKMDGIPFFELPNPIEELRYQPVHTLDISIDNFHIDFNGDVASAYVFDF